MHAMNEPTRLSVGAMSVFGLGLMFPGSLFGQSGPTGDSAPAHTAPGSAMPTPETKQATQCLEPSSPASEQARVKVKFPTLPQAAEAGGGRQDRIEGDSTTVSPADGHPDCCRSVDRQMGKPKYEDITVKEPCASANAPAGQSCEPPQADRHSTRAAPSPVPMPYPHVSAHGDSNGSVADSRDPMLCKKRRSVTFQDKTDQQILAH
jgi:hypothetical protein